MPAIEWTSGIVDKAPDWQTLLDRIRSAQWGSYREDEFRAVLAKRAMRWAGVEIDPDLPPIQLFAALEGARLIEIVDRETADPTEED